MTDLLFGIADETPVNVGSMNESAINAHGRQVGHGGDEDYNAGCKVNVVFSLLIQIKYT